MADEALPAGNGVAAFALNRLGHLLGDMRYLEAAERTVRSAAATSAVQQYPHAHCTLLAALEEVLDPPQLLVLRGEGDALRAFVARAGACFAPRRLTLAIPNDAGPLPGLLAAREAGAAPVTAWLCDGQRGDAPTSDFATFERMLAACESPAPR